MRPQILIPIFFLLAPAFCIAQDGDDDSGGSSDAWFQFGFQAGPYFPNHKSATVYDGYGFDVNGGKNEFSQSVLYRRIVVENTGNFALSDQVANAISVDPGMWSFSQGDMPTGLRYGTGFQFGINTRFRINKLRSVLLNFQSVRLKVGGEFTIQKTGPPTGTVPPGTTNQALCYLEGQEQRMMVQLGYAAILGKTENFNFFAEAGFNVLFSKFRSLQAQINTLTLDLTQNYTNDPFVGSSQAAMSGVGIGAFGGPGVNISMSRKWTLQFLYTLSYDQVNLGDSPGYGYNHAIAFRVYGNF